MFGDQKTTQKSEELNGMPPSIIGADLTVTGNVTSKGAIQVEGEIQGDVFCTSITIGTQGRVTGGITAEEVNVHGRIIGSIRAISVTLQAAAHVEGDIHHQSLKLEHGGFFEGKSLRSDEPVSIFEPVPANRETIEAQVQDNIRAHNAKLHQIA